MTTRRWLLTTVAAIAALLVAGRIIADAYADYSWYQALGATAVWSAQVGAVTMSRLVALFTGTVFAMANLLTVRRSVVYLVLQRQVGNLQIGETVPPRYLTGAAALASLVIGAALAFTQSDWTQALLARSGLVFNEVVAGVNVDIGFFVYWLPFENDLWTWSLLLVCTVTLVVVTLYVLTDGLRIENGRFVASSHARRHLAALAGVFLLLLAWYFRLSMYGLLLAGSGGVGEGALSSVHLWLGVPGTLALAIGTLVAGLVVLWTGATGQFRLSTYAGIFVFVLWVLVRQVVPVAAELTDQSDVIERERQYLATQAAYTRRAFGVEASAPTPGASYDSFAEVVNGLQLWDPPALRRAIAPTRVPDTTNSWIGWRVMPTSDSSAGHGTAELLADVVVRGEERSDRRVPWLVARVDASAVDADGGPVPVADPSVPVPELRAGERGLSPPLVFPGADGYEVLPDSVPRLTGISLASPLARLALAWSLQNPSLVFGTLADRHPTLMTHRDVRDRIARLVPFFEQGSVITPIVVGDSIYWAVDLYSASRWYPLSHRLAAGRWSYFHHAAVAIVAGGSGAVAVIADTNRDPIASTWVQLFPTLFASWSALPAAVHEALPPLVDAAQAQLVAIARFGTDGDSAVERHTPSDGGDSVLSTREPVFVMPGTHATATTFPLIDGADRVRGTLVATGGRERRSVWVPAREPFERWTMLVDRLRELDSTTARRERQIAHGRVRMIPVRDRWAYVRPVFGWPAQSAPSLDYVVFVDHDSAQRTASLRDAADVLGGQTTPELRARVTALYEAMRSAQQRGDWGAYGRAFDELGRTLGRTRGR